MPLLIFPSKTGTLESKILLRFFNLGFYNMEKEEVFGVARVSAVVGPQGREKKRRDSETTTRARDGSPTRHEARAKASEREREKKKQRRSVFPFYKYE